MKKKKLLLVITLLVSILLISGCQAPSTPSHDASSGYEKVKSDKEKCCKTKKVKKNCRKDDIVILYTNDIHGVLDDNIGFDGVSSYKNEMQKKTPYVSLVDCGDFVSGTYYSAASSGLAMVDAMNEVGFDYTVIGNHEFDYKISGLKNILDEMDATVLNSNITYTGSGENVLKNTKPYDIVSYGDTKVGFVGVSTPLTMTGSSPAYFKENDEFVYDFCEGNDGKNLYTCVQKNVNLCKKAGADYVVVLSHLGDASIVYSYCYSSDALIENTTGIDAVLDAHAHSVISCDKLLNSEGETVLRGSTGTNLKNIGKLVITPSGELTLENISSEDYTEKDSEITSWIENLKDVYDGILGEPLFELENTLSIFDEEGIRTVRNRETGLGSFCADAYRYVMDADIGFCNGGGIRNSLNAGSVTTANLIEVNPYGNQICKIEISGQKLLDILEDFYMYVKEDYKEDGSAIGEIGSFMHISGMKVTIDTSIEPSVEIDESASMLGVGDTRRVKDVEVLEGNEYVPIDPEKNYTIALPDYIAVNGGCEMEYMLKDATMVISPSISDYECLICYARDGLSFDLSQYETPQGRITITSGN